MASQSFNTFSTHMTFLEYHDGMLYPNKINLTAMFSIKEQVPNEVFAEILRNRSRFLLTYLDKSIFINSTDPLQYALFIKNYKTVLKNNVVSLPFFLADFNYARILSRKLNALARGIINYDSLTITRSMIDSDEMGIHYMPDHSEEIMTMDKWVGPRAFHDKPWWERNDFSTIDRIPEEGDDINVSPDYVPSDLVEPRRRAFNPTIIDGGIE